MMLNFTCTVSYFTILPCFTMCADFTWMYFMYHYYHMLKMSAITKFNHNEKYWKHQIKTHKRHPISHPHRITHSSHPLPGPQRQIMRCLWWFFGKKNAKSWWDYELKTDTPYLTISGKLWGTYYEYLGENCGVMMRQETHNRHPIAHPHGQAMGCL